MRILCLGVSAVLLVIACEPASVLDEAQGEFDAGRYREAIYILRHHAKRGGEETPEHLVLAARCWMRLEIEAEAVEALARAVGIDSTYGARAAELLREEAYANMEMGYTARGRRYILRALDYDSLLDFGGYNAVAGELLLERKRFGPAADYFNRYLEAFPDTAGAAAVMLNLGEAYEGRGMSEEAVSLYRRFQEQYPKSRLNTTVAWKLENLLFTQGEELYAQGEIEEAESVFSELARTADNTIVRERVFFVLGEINERRGDFERATHYYTEVVHLNLDWSGRLAAQAKERIERLEQMRNRR